MRVIHIIPPNCIPTLSDVHDAAGRFYGQFKVKPARIAMSSYDMMNFLKGLVIPPIAILESGKQYSNYIITAYGPLPLEVFDDEDIAVSTSYSPANPSSHSIIIVDNMVVDKEFEKHVLNEEKSDV